jgi:hypothetical protein
MNEQLSKKDFEKKMKEFSIEKHKDILLDRL